MPEQFSLLVVDDQLGIRKLLVETFAGKYIVKEAQNGQEALQKLASDKLDLVLLDMKMPGISGIETLQKIREINSEIPVILMTAYGESDLIDQAKIYGTVKYISKPFDLNTIRNLVKELLV